MQPFKEISQHKGNISVKGQIDNIEKNSEEKAGIVISDNYPESIPDYAIRRFAKFLLPLMQADFEDEESAHLYSPEKPF